MKGLRMKTNKSKVIVSALVLIAVSTVLATAAVAKHRRLGPAAYCKEAHGWDHSISDRSGKFYAQYRWTEAVCGIPSDSHFTHSEINLINVHVKNSTSTSDGVYAKPCVTSYAANSTYCENTKGTTASGEQMLQWKAADLQKFDDSKYAAWSPIVWVDLGKYDILRLIYVTN
jgi:hypothetical protein